LTTRQALSPVMSGTQPISNNRIESDPLAKIIVNMLNAMQADYGQTFIKQFGDAEVLKNYKRRLYQKLGGLPINAIIEGYELCTELNKKFCPHGTGNSSKRPGDGKTQ